MFEFIAQNMAPIMFITVMLMLLLGYPVAFTLAAGGLGFFVIGVELSDLAPQNISLSWPLLQANVNRVFDVMRNDTLLAIPFFTLMGLILERSRMAEDLLDTIGQLFGSLRGGLAYAVVFVGALLGATTGVVAASVMAMGLISLPIMLRYGYDTRLSTGTILASGTLAQVMPPSIVIIVMADQLGVSVGDMYLGAIFPALILIVAYALFVFLMTLVRPSAMPAMPAEARTLGKGITSLLVVVALSTGAYLACYHWFFNDLRYEDRVVVAGFLATALALSAALANRWLKLKLISLLAERVIIALIPPLALIFFVLGTIFLGIATPTEGGAMGAAGALVLALIKKRLGRESLKQALDSTTRLVAFVMFILIGARVFGLTFYGVNGNVWIEELLLVLPGGEKGFLIMITALIFILGCFLDFFEIAFIVVPLIIPAAEALGIDLVWLGIILSINLTLSFLTPPFGFALFYLRSVAPSEPWDDQGRKMAPIRTIDIYRGVVPFIIIQLCVILLMIWMPDIVTHYQTNVDLTNLDDVQIDIAPWDGGDTDDPFGF